MQDRRSNVDFDRIEERLRDDRAVHVEIAGDAPSGLIDRIGEALGSERGFFFFLGTTFGLILAGVILNAWGVR